MVAETVTETELSAAQRNLATVQEIYQAFGRGDVGSILERLSGDVQWDQGIRQTDLPYLQPSRGHQAVIEFFTALAANVAFDVFEPQLFTANAEAVMVFGEGARAQPQHRRRDRRGRGGARLALRQRRQGQRLPPRRGFRHPRTCGLEDRGHAGSDLGSVTEL